MSDHTAIVFANVIGDNVISTTRGKIMGITVNGGSANAVAEIFDDPVDSTTPANKRGQVQALIGDSRYVEFEGARFSAGLTIKITGTGSSVMVEYKENA